MAEIPTGTLIRENSISGGNSTGAVRRPTIRLITPITEDSQKTTPETPSPAPLDSSPSPSLNREKSFKRERRNSFIPVFFVCKVYVKANGQQSPRHQLEPLVVERDWTFDDFLTFASRKIDMTNASRAFSRLGNQDCDSSSPCLLLFFLMLLLNISFTFLILFPFFLIPSFNHIIFIVLL